MPGNHWSLATQLIHGDGEAAPDPGVGTPTSTLIPSTAFAYPTAEALEAVFAGRAPGHVYSRISNPTVLDFERRIAVLEGGRGAIACASGMAAISATALALAEAGDQLVSANSIFGGTYALFARTLARCGISTTFVDATDLAAVRQALTDRTRMLFVETIGNPKLDVPDLAALAGVAAAAGVPLVVDSTVTTPLLVRPGALGASVVIHSASKFINGHGNAMGGLIVDCGNFEWARLPGLQAVAARAGGFALLATLRNQVGRDLGGCLAPFNAFLLTMGLESLDVRMERHCANAATVAAALAAHPRVVAVRYPGLSGHPQHDLASRQFGGRFGAVLTLRLASREQCFRFINGLRLVTNLANLGDARTLVIHPASTFCRDASEEQRRAMGVSDDLVRLAIGLEHPDDLLSDLMQSLNQS